MIRNDSTILLRGFALDTTTVRRAKADTSHTHKPNVATKTSLKRHEVSLTNLAQMRADSIHKSDSLKAVQLANVKKLHTSVKVKNISGHEGKFLPSFPQSESWVFVLFAFLLLLLVSGVRKSGGILLKDLRTFLKRKDNFYTHPTSTVNLIEFKLLFTLFFLLIFTFFVYALFYSSSAGFHFLIFLKLLGVTTLFFTLKILLAEFVGMVFFNIKQRKLYQESFLNLTIPFSILLFGLSVIMVYHPSEWIIPYHLIAIILISMFYILLLVKVFLIFYSKLLDFFYIFLYLCTLEILPLFILFRAYNLIM